MAQAAVLPKAGDRDFCLEPGPASAQEPALARVLQLVTVVVAALSAPALALVFEGDPVLGREWRLVAAGVPVPPAPEPGPASVQGQVSVQEQVSDRVPQSAAVAGLALGVEGAAGAGPASEPDTPDLCLFPWLAAVDCLAATSLFQCLFRFPYLFLCR